MGAPKRQGASQKNWQEPISTFANLTDGFQFELMTKFSATPSQQID
jgi:hypothetical protein